MKKLIFPLIAIVLIGFIGYQNKDYLYTSVTRFSQTETLTTEEVRQVIVDGASWFKNSQDFSGKFKYEYMPFLDRYIEDDNMVRQAGGLYVLGELYRKDPENKLELEKYIIEAIEYFKENTAAGSYNSTRFNCLLKTSTRCTLGGTSLLMIGVLEFAEANPSMKEEYEELIEDYKDYILAMKKDGAGFRDRFYLKGSQSSDESSFSNGEAMLALTRYYKYNPDEEVKKVIDESYEYFEETYRAQWDNNFYLWGMGAIKDLYEEDPREEYFEFVKDYTDWRMGVYANARGSSRNRCAYIEGVASAYSVMEPNLSQEDKEYYLEEIDYWLAHSSLLQVHEDDFLRVAYNNNFFKKLVIEEEKLAVGGFLTATNEPVQRIDFTQHCLNSYLQKLVDIDGEKL